MNLYFVIAIVGMTSLALGLLLLPLIARQRRAAGRDAYNLAVYRDQLTEVDRDAARGTLPSDQAEAARAEIGRRILALKPAEPASGEGPAPAVASVVAILLMPIAALSLYGALGSPFLPDLPFAGRGAAASGMVAGDDSHIDMTAALAKLRAHLKDHPDDLTGWLLLARSEVGTGRYREGAEAYRHAVDLSGHRADILGDWGEAQVLAAGGTVTPAAEKAFAGALKDPETAPRSRYYLALAQMQHGDAKGALKAWRALAADSPTNAAWLPVVRQRIAEASAKLGIDPPAIKTNEKAAVPATGMPSAATVASTAKALQSASPDQKLTMIKGMVERLAARLKRQPDDAAGWAQLGRSYMVLNEPDKARAAYERAVKLRPDDSALKSALAAAGEAAAQPSR